MHTPEGLDPDLRGGRPIPGARWRLRGAGIQIHARGVALSLAAEAVQRRLAAQFGLGSYLDVGVAGRKDKVARATQWFSVPCYSPTLERVVDDAASLVPAPLEVLRAERCSRKLRRNGHAGNRFEVTVTDVEDVAAALEARYLSALVAQRRRFSSIATVGVHEDLCPRIPENVLEDALLCAKICSYAQGMSLIRTTSLAKGWSAEPDAVLRCWQGGCIIRADLLKDFRKAYADDPSLENLLMHPSIVSILTKDRIHAWRAVVGVAVQRGLPVPCLLYTSPSPRDRG